MATEKRHGGWGGKMREEDGRQPPENKEEISTNLIQNKKPP